MGLQKDTITTQLILEDTYWGPISLAALKNRVAIAYIHGGYATGPSEITIDLLRLSTLKIYRTITTQEIRQNS